MQKETLLKVLEEYIRVENDIEKKLSEFCLALDWMKTFPVEQHDDIKAAFNTMVTDSAKHAQMNEQLVNYIKRTQKNEF